MNKYVRKLFGMMFQSQQTQQVVHIQSQPTPISPEEWRAHWQAKGFPWRTEPEIDAKRQEELSKCRAIVPDIEKGIYPFKGMKLSRADVEWLLATHENGRGPVDWSDEWQRKREGLDLRGADLRKEDLRALPLACLIGGMSVEEDLTAQFADVDTRLVYLYLEGADLSNAHLEGAKLCGVNLENANLFEAYMQVANLSGSYLNGAWLDKAHLENADFSDARLRAANLDEAYLEGAKLRGVWAEGTNLDGAHLEKTDLRNIHLEKASLKETFLNNADLSYAQLAGANLHRAHLEGANLTWAHLEGKCMLAEDMPSQEMERVRTWFHGLRWRGMEDVLTFEEGKELQEEFPEELPPANLSGAFFDSATLLEKTYLGDRKYGFVSLVDVSWGDTNLSVVNWTKVKMLGDESTARQKKTSGDKRGKLVEYQLAVRANRQLAVALQDQGLNEDAARFAFRAQVLQRKVFWRQLNFWKWSGSALLALLAGYGYRMWHILVAYVLVVLLCAAAYFVLGMYYEPHLSLLEAVLTSVTAFHGRVFSEPFLRPGEPQLWVTAFEAVAGLIVEGVFIAMLTQKFFGK